MDIRKQTAEAILREWMQIISASKGDQWYMIHGRQAYEFSLKAMIHYGLIKSFSVATGEIILPDDE